MFEQFIPFLSGNFSFYIYKLSALSTSALVPPVMNNKLSFRLFPGNGARRGLSARFSTPGRGGGGKFGGEFGEDDDRSRTNRRYFVVAKHQRAWTRILPDRIVDARISRGITLSKWHGRRERLVSSRNVRELYSGYRSSISTCTHTHTRTHVLRYTW